MNTTVAVGYDRALPGERIAEYGAGRARTQHPGLSVEACAVAGYAGKMLAEAGRSAELLVVGNRSTGGFQGMLLGSTSLRTLAESCCPVIVVRGDALDPHHRIVAAVDIDDENCDTVLDFAFDEATYHGAGLTPVLPRVCWSRPRTMRTCSSPAHAGTAKGGTGCSWGP